MHAPIAQEMWVCPGCGGPRVLIGPRDYRAVRCPSFEGGFSSTLLTREDHEFLKDAGVRAEAYYCLRYTCTPRAWFKSIAEAETFYPRSGKLADLSTRC